MKDIRKNFSTKIAKKIFWKADNWTIFLEKLSEKKDINLPLKVISKGKNKWKSIINLSNNEIWDMVIKHWDYSIWEKIIRELFKGSEKYSSWKDSYNTMNILKDEWNKLNLNEVKWPFSQWQFDWFVQQLNSQSISWFEKDDKVKIAAVKYRRIKEINTVRNDFIETLIFEKNNNILPTLNHRRWVDFFINGISYDQKVAKSPTNEFKRKYWDNWKETAIKNPKIVAEYLYKYQDEWRFWADSRLLVVYLDEEVSIEKISNTIDKVNFDKPTEIVFTYTHNKWNPSEYNETYKVNCFIILLYS